jgi:hypothetical protein
MNYKKPTIFYFGACDVGIALNNPLIKNTFSLFKNERKTDSLDFDTCWFPDYSTSLISLYTPPPSEIASRVYDSLVKCKELTSHHYQAYREIFKYPYLENFAKNAGPNDILVLNFSSELYTKISCKSEWFTLLPCFNKLNHPDDPLKWLVDDYLMKKEYQVPGDSEIAVNDSWNLLARFANDIYKIFKNRVVLVNTHLTDLSIHKGKIVKTPIKQQLSYRQSKLSADYIEHNYAQRITNMVIRKFRIKYPDELPVVAVDDLLFLDPEHPSGYSPFHFDKTSAEKIAYKIYLELLKINSKLTHTTNSTIQLIV